MNKNQAEARAKAVKTLERALTDRNNTIKELRKEIADLTQKLDLLHQAYCDKGPPRYPTAMNGHVIQYDENVFVFFDETENAEGAARSYEEAQRRLLEYARSLDQPTPRDVNVARFVDNVAVEWHKCVSCEGALCGMMHYYPLCDRCEKRQTTLRWSRRPEEKEQT